MANQSTQGFNGNANYLGTGFFNAAVYVQERDPIPTDQNGIPLGTLWINVATDAVFMLTQKLYDNTIKKTVSTWIGISGNFFNEVHTDAGIATPLAGVLAIFGGTNINTNAAANSVFINLDDTVSIGGTMSADDGFITLNGNINLPNTNTTGTEGIIQFDVDRFISNFGVENTFVGANSGNTTLTGSGNTALGTDALASITTGLNNTAIGVSSLTAQTTLGGNVALGWSALNALTAGSNNIAIGNLSGSGYSTNEASNICINAVGTPLESHVIRIGTDGTGPGQQDTCYIAGTTHIARNLNLKFTNAAGTEGAIYTGDGVSLTRFITNPGFPAAFNIFVGEACGPTFPYAGAAQGNTGLGANVMTAIVGASGNTSVGFGSGNAIANNVDNTCLGHNAGNLLATGDLNCFVGAFSGAVLTGNAGAIGNTALGYGALNNCTSGSANLCLGGLSGQNLTTNESHNLIIYNSGVVGRSHEIRIGSTGGGDGQQSKCWIAAIRGVTTDVADAIPVLIDSTGQLGTVSSSERYKDDIEDMGPESDMVMALRPVTFTYKSDQTKTKHYGLIAEETHEVFPSLVVYDKEGLPDTVKYHELPVLLLNELQKCMATIANLQERIAILEKGHKKTR